MKEVLQKIAAFPKFNLSDEGWDDVSELISALPKETMDALKSYLADLKLHQKDIDKINSIASAWFELTQAMCRQCKYLGKIWFKVINKNMTAEDLLPLLIALLPNNKIELQQNQIRLDIAIRISSKGENSFALTMFYSANKNKLDEFTSTLTQNDNPSINKVATEVLKIEQLLILCVTYKYELRDRFIALFKSTGNETYEKILGNPIEITDKNKIMDIIIAHVSIHDLNLQPDTLNLMFKKYLAMDEMHLTLLKVINVNGSAAHQMREFSGKFDQHHDILMKSLSNATVKSLKESAQSYFSNYIDCKNNKQKFMELASAYSNTMQTETADLFPKAT